MASRELDVAVDIHRYRRERYLDKLPEIAQTIQRMLRRKFPGRDAGSCADIARLAALRSCKGMVSNQNARFLIPESRQ
jgi:hypothetical protein